MMAKTDREVRHMIGFREFSAGCAAMLLAGCATTSAFEKAYPAGKAVGNHVTVGTKSVPLPPGNWVVAAHDTTTSSASTPLAGLALVNTAPKAHAVLVTIYTNVEVSNGGFGWTTLKACSRDDMIFVDAPENHESGPQRCRYINHSGTTRAASTAKMLKDTLDFAQARRLPIPSTAVYAGFRLADSYDALTVRYYFNPETQGFAESRTPAWRYNDWHRDHSAYDERKTRYLDGMKAWGVQVIAAMRAGFAGKPAPITTYAMP
jgi:hypothetical protein